MTTVTKNLEYQGLDHPVDTVAPPSLNKFKDVRRLTATADTANLLAGLLCYLTGTTQANDMTEAGALRGNTDEQGDLFVVEIVEHDPAFPTTTARPQYPNKIPNSDVSASIADYKHAANDDIIVIPLEIGMKVWLLIGNDITADTTYGNIYYPAANGYVGAGGDPDGAAIDKVAHAFKALATFTNSNWALFEYIGYKAFDNTSA